jgi:hypothetical protein
VAAREGPVHSRLLVPLRSTEVKDQVAHNGCRGFRLPIIIGVQREFGMNRLAQMTALVIGGVFGLGKAAVRRLAADGACDYRHPMRSGSRDCLEGD